MSLVFALWFNCTVLMKWSLTLNYGLISPQVKMKRHPNLWKYDFTILCVINAIRISLIAQNGFVSSVPHWVVEVSNILVSGALIGVVSSLILASVIILIATKVWKRFKIVWAHFMPNRHCVLHSYFRMSFWRVLPLSQLFKWVQSFEMTWHHNPDSSVTYLGGDCCHRNHYSFWLGSRHQRKCFYHSCKLDNFNIAALANSLIFCFFCNYKRK